MNQSIFIAGNNPSLCLVSAHTTLLWAHPEALVLNVGQVSGNTFVGGAGLGRELGIWYPSKIYHMLWGHVAPIAISCLLSPALLTSSNPSCTWLAKSASCYIIKRQIVSYKCILEQTGNECSSDDLFFCPSCTHWVISKANWFWRANFSFVEPIRELRL